MTKGDTMKTILSRTWFLYVLWALVSGTVAPWIISLVNAPSSSEKVQLFLSGYSYDDEKLNNALSSAKPAYLREISFRFGVPGDVKFASLYDGYARSSADIIILPAESVNSNKCQYDFLRLDKETALKTFGPVTIYEDSGYSYGLKVYDSQSHTGWASSCISYSKEVVDEQDYYLFFNRSSVHTGALGGKEKDGAIEIALALQKL